MLFSNTVSMSRVSQSKLIEACIRYMLQIDTLGGGGREGCPSRTLVLESGLAASGKLVFELPPHLLDLSVHVVLQLKSATDGTSTRDRSDYKTASFESLAKGESTKRWEDKHAGRE